MINEWWVTGRDANGRAPILKADLDRVYDLAYITVHRALIFRTLRISPHVLLDLDDAGQLVGIEILKASGGHEGPQKVLVCGGRDYADGRLLGEVLDAINPRSIAHGGAPGADRLAGRWAHAREVPCVEVHADWERNGRNAGPIRNRAMFRAYHPDLVLAFPGGLGTADMVAVARRGHCPVVLIARRLAVAFKPSGGPTDV